MIQKKEQSKVWVSKTDPRPTKVHRNKSSDKRMVAIFFMKSGLIKSVPLEAGVTVNASWYVNTCLPQVFKAVSERRQTRGPRSLIFHDDNARPHRACITNEFLAENHVEPYPNPPYSPDLSPCDFFLFPKLKNQLRGIQFNDDNAMLTALEQAIDSLTKEDFKNCFEDWFIRMHKCIDAEGQYFEKIH
jgi:histone-lysine N-methyltransferase SETMAR